MDSQIQKKTNIWVVEYRMLWVIATSATIVLAERWTPCRLIHDKPICEEVSQFMAIYGRDPTYKLI